MGISPPRLTSTYALLHYRIYECAPDCDWVIFVHGAGGSSTTWFKQIRDFSRHFNVLVVDLRGHGGSRHLSAHVTSNYSFEDISRDILEVMDHLHIEQANFVGMSLGSILVRNLAEMAPDRVQSLILGGAITRFNLRSRFLVSLGNLFKRIVPYMWLYRFFAWIIMPRKSHREARLLFISDAQKLCQREFIRWFRLTWRINPLLKLFEEKEIHVPTLYLMGQQDHMFLPPVRQLIKKHKNSFLQIIENAGHVCNIDRPQLFNRYALTFLQTHTRKLSTSG